MALEEGYSASDTVTAVRCRITKSLSVCPNTNFCVLSEAGRILTEVGLATNFLVNDFQGVQIAASKGLASKRSSSDAHAEQSTDRILGCDEYSQHSVQGFSPTSAKGEDRRFVSLLLARSGLGTKSRAE